MNQLTLLLIACVFSCKLFAQQIKFEISDLELVNLLNNSAADLNSLEEFKSKTASQYYDKSDMEMAKQIEAKDLSEFQKELVNEMYKRFDLGNDETPYHFIAEKGKLEYLKLHPSFLKNKYSIDSTNKYGNAPIHYAVSYKKENALETVQALISEGANAKLKGEYGNTILHLSAKKNSLYLLRYLLGQGLNVNDTTNKGNTALHFACSNNNKEMVDYLLDKGAVLDEVNFPVKGPGFGNHLTILHVSAINGWFDILDKCLDAKLDINCKAETRMEMHATPLFSAVTKNKFDAVKYLIEHGADVNAYEQTMGYSPLVKAIFNQNKEIFDFLMAQNPNVNIPVPNMKRFPIYRCFSCSNEKLGHHFAKAIITSENYIDPMSDEAKKSLDEMYKRNSLMQVKIRSSFKYEKDMSLADYTPLHWCAIMGWADLCELLIQKGTNVDVQTEKGSTPLQKAVENKKYEAVKLLMQKGADPKHKNAHGETAFDIAKEKKDKEIVELLKGK